MPKILWVVGICFGIYFVASLVGTASITWTFLSKDYPLNQNNFLYLSGLLLVLLSLWGALWGMVKRAKFGYWCSVLLLAYFLVTNIHEWYSIGLVVKQGSGILEISGDAERLGAKSLMPIKVTIEAVMLFSLLLSKGIKNYFFAHHAN